MNTNEFQAGPNDLQHVENVVQQSGTSFFWGMRMLPPDRRMGMFAVYAFCREADDIADEAGTIAEKTQGLADWRAEIDRLFQGCPQTPTGRALLRPVAEYDLRRDDFIAVIDGMEMDAAPAVRIRDRAELALYCDRVACAVGRLSNRVFGLAGNAGDPIAKALGEALQLTNILRDVVEDAERDRLYLPADRLMAAGIADPADLAAVLAAPGLAAVMADLGAEAGRRFAEARRLLAASDRRVMRPAILMMEVYWRTWQALQKRGWGKIHQPVKVGKAAKLWVVARHGFF